jgi:dipeptidyl aminopeptidase/acylaminoacyl peptidase
MKNLISNIFIAVLAINGSPDLQSQDRLTPEKLWQLSRVSLYDVSPDGKTVLFGITNFDIAENKGIRDLFIMQADGSNDGKPVQITKLAGNENEAKYRLDGKKIGFLYNGKLWEMNTDGSDAKQISDLPVNGFHYFPDGKKILIIQDVKYDKRTDEIYPDLKKAEAKIIDGLMYRHWDSWEDGLYSNIFVIGYDDGKLSGEPRNIMGEAFDSPLKPMGGMEQITISPNSQFIAYTCKKEKGTAATVSTNSDIFVFDLLTGKTKNMSAGNMGYDMNPVFSPNGRYLAWESMKTPGYESDRHRIRIYDFTTDKSWEVTEGLEQNAMNPQWAPDGSGIYFNSQIHGTEQIFFVDFLKGGRLRQLSEGQYNYGAFKVAGSNIIAIRCSMAEPHELFRLPTDTGRANQLTFTNKAALDKLNMAKVEKRWVTTTDGKKMLTWVVLPPNFDPAKKYPALLYCQGGPQNTVSQFWSYRWNLQLMAADDYIVVAPNRRGLPSFGNAWNEQISGDYGGQAMQDLLSAIDAVAAEPYVDKNALGAVGASFGGYSVFWLAGNHNKRFKAFIAHDGMFNFESWYGTTEEMFFANHDLSGSYWQNPLPETWKLDSPHKYVQNWDTPILVIHGGKDFRVPETEGMQAFQAAQLRGIPSRFLYFPNEGHWILSAQNGILWQREFFGWLDKWLKAKP